jgi:hypothetical protein
VFGFCDFYDLKEDRSGSGPKAMNFLLRLVASSLLSDDVEKKFPTPDFDRTRIFRI